MKTLSDKRADLRFQAFENGIGESEIFRIIEEQDKQFIKDLKEHFNDAHIDEGIDKLAGDKLI